MNRIKDAAIVILLAMNVYLVATRDSNTDFSDSSLSSTALIAVIPFLNLSGDEQYEYVSDSVWVQTVEALGEIPGLTVASHRSASAFKGTSQNFQDIGEALGVSYVLEGGVRRFGTGASITVHLVQVTSDSHVWPKSFNREADSLDYVPNDIAKSVAVAIKDN